MIRPCLVFASVREAIRQYAVGEQTDGFRIRTAKKVNEYFSCLLFCGSTAGLPKIQQPHDMTVGLETGLPQIAQEFASKREAHAVAVSRDREGEGKERGLLNDGKTQSVETMFENIASSLKIIFASEKAEREQREEDERQRAELARRRDLARKRKE